MRAVPFCFALLFSTLLFGQSKKELQDQVNALKAQIEQLKKGKEVDLNNEHKKASYALGVLMASNVKRQGGDSLDVDAISVGMQDLFMNRPLKINEPECMMVIQPYMQKSIERKAGKAKEEGKAFLESNKTKEGVVVTASGLQYKVLTSGNGKTPTTTDKVTVHYTGKLLDGSIFDSSVSTGNPATFKVTQVITGWQEALQLMHEGDQWMVYIPSELAYGERGSGAQIPPFATLVFELELIKVN